jgi:hypothetical protein
MPSEAAIARAAAHARTIADASVPAAASSSLAPALAAARAALGEFDRAEAAPAAIRTPGRPAAPMVDSTWRLRLGGCGHLVAARSGERIGTRVSCAACSGIEREVVGVLRPGEHVFGRRERD